MGGLFRGVTRTGFKLVPGVLACNAFAFLALSFMFKADWQWHSDAATWSIWLLIRSPTPQKPQWQPPPPYPPPHTQYTTVRLQLGPHPNPWFAFRVIILSTCANAARRAVQCKHVDLYFVRIPRRIIWWFFGWVRGVGWHRRSKCLTRSGPTVSKALCLAVRLKSMHSGCCFPINWNWGMIAMHQLSEWK